MVGTCENTGFCNVTPFTVHTFFWRTFGAIPDNSQRFKVISLRFHYIAVVNVDHRLTGCHTPNKTHIILLRFFRDPQSMSALNFASGADSLPENFFE